MFKLNEEVKVNYPDELLKNMHIEGVMISPYDTMIGVTALSQQINQDHVLRLYSLVLNEDGFFEVIYELQAFSMQTKEDIRIFLEKLPAMSAIELMMIMNPIPQIASH
ncbi:hypothetical protein KGF86_01790 [Ornithinibacillus massiliensis]|uniref:Uncharacterized protein n=1 Tax=Ornithinibacillus massiliensis TaxID=1944633 RepID=A0ABS5M9E5_9BACI|nr:hypothetical protein [Ornithinibacillus massiliensis]MBS3678936.1 hypothetical protein [Ornithinibacillus massiliensis]